MTASPRPSSSLCLVRDGAGGIEVLMAQRTHTARFMPGAWVFPGGVVDETDWSAEAAAALAGLADRDALGWVAAAVRETVEETGVWLSEHPFTVSEGERTRGVDIFDRAATRAPFEVAGFAYFANWITPADLPVRFDTRFYLDVTTSDIVGEPDRSEMDAVAWVAAVEAVERGSAGAMSVPFPTVKTLEWFASFESAADLLGWAHSLEHVPVTEPRLRVDHGTVQVVLPWDPGYDELPEIAEDADLLSMVRSARGVDGTPAAELVPPGGEPSS